MMELYRARAGVLVLALACIAATPASPSAPSMRVIPNPVQLETETNTTGTATCRASDGSLGVWSRLTGVSTTAEPSVLDAEAGSKTPPDAMLYCRDQNGRPGKIEASPTSLVYPEKTLLQPVYQVTITRPAGDQQPPFEVALGPTGSIQRAPFGQAIIFSKHSMLIVPSGWKIESKPIAIAPKRPGTFTSTLDEGGCEVNRMDDEDADPRYIGEAVEDCSVKIDLSDLQ
jgi:hypothetical protein